MDILLVEDDAIIAMTLEAALADAGYVVRGPASTAARGLEIAEREPPDLALVDINLRDGSNGIDLARELLNRWGIPSLLISGQRMEAYANRDAALGYIGKPYSPDTVLASIEVAKHMIDGLPPPTPLPRELELFQEPGRPAD